jgi:hypothetical protein
MAPMTRLFSASWQAVAAACALLALCAPGPASAARKPRPDVTIALAPLGFGTIPGAYLQAGQTMYTLNFVDDTHLLLTFHTSGLLKRLKDAETSDEDRNVAALLLELPSGRVVTRSILRTRDHGRYLWPLGNGRFMLRSRNRFSVIDPVRGLKAGHAFEATNLVTLDHRIVLVNVSADGGLLMVETGPAMKPPLIGAAASAAALAATVPQPPKLKTRTQLPGEFLLHFYRLVTEKQPEGERLVAQAAGGVRAINPADLAMTPLGYLGVVKESAQVYNFDFYSYSGKKLELSPYETSCPPLPVFTSGSDFVAFGCRGGLLRNQISGFNLRGEEPWVSVLPGEQAAVFLMSAPAGGRFALSVMSNPPVTALGMGENIPRPATQQVQVLQHHDGRVLLAVPTGPVQLAGQNFDLSADGLLFAAVQVNEIGIYRLPPLTRTDQKMIAASAAAFHEEPVGPVRLQVGTVMADGGTVQEIAAPSSTAVAGNPATSGSPGAANKAEALPNVSSAEQAVPPANSEGAEQKSAANRPQSVPIVNGDQPSEDVDLIEGHRKPPSLYDADHPKLPNP